MAETEASTSLTACLRPFEPLEVRRLRRFHKQVEKLSSYRFLRDSAGPMQLQGTMAGGQINDIRYIGPDREALDAVAPAFRELYGEGRRNHGSGSSISQMVRANALSAGTEPGRQLAAQLEDFGRALNRRSRRDPRIGLIFENPGPVGSSSLLSPRRAIDLFFNGEVFHYELAKADEFEDMPLAEQGIVMMVHSAIRDFVPLWKKLDRLIWAILSEQHLVGQN
jgi:hypothetical protein